MDAIDKCSKYSRYKTKTLLSSSCLMLNCHSFLEYHVQSHSENTEKVSLVILFPDARSLVALCVLVGEQAGMLLLMDNRERSSSLIQQLHMMKGSLGREQETGSLCFLTYLLLETHCWADKALL